MYFLKVVVDICTNDYLPLWNIVGFVINVIKIGIPILLIVIGMIDFAKAVIANKEEAQKKVMSTIGKRFLYAIGVFSSVWIVSFILDIAADTVGKNNEYYKYDESSWRNCWALINGEEIENTGDDTVDQRYCFECSGGFEWLKQKPYSGCTLREDIDDEYDCKNQNKYCHYCESSRELEFSQGYTSTRICNDKDGWKIIDKIKNKNDCTSYSEVEKKYGKCFECAASSAIKFWGLTENSKNCNNVCPAGGWHSINSTYDNCK